MDIWLEMAKENERKAKLAPKAEADRLLLLAKSFREQAERIRKMESL